MRAPTRTPVGGAPILPYPLPNAGTDRSRAGRALNQRHLRNRASCDMLHSRKGRAAADKPGYARHTPRLGQCWLSLSIVPLAARHQAISDALDHPPARTLFDRASAQRVPHRPCGPRRQWPRGAACRGTDTLNRPTGGRLPLPCRRHLLVVEGAPACAPSPACSRAHPDVGNCRRLGIDFDANMWYYGTVAFIRTPPQPSTRSSCAGAGHEVTTADH